MEDPSPAEPATDDSRDGSSTPWTGLDILVSFSAGTFGGMLAVGFLFAGLAGAVSLSPSSQLVIVGLTLYGSVSLFVWYLAIKRRGASWESVGFRRVQAKVLLTMIPVTFGVMIVNAVILLAIGALVGGVPSVRAQLLPEGAQMSFADLLWLLSLGVVMAPLAEEFLFRGILYRYLRSKSGVGVASALSAALFALMHIVPALLASLFALGVFLALIVERYKSLFPAMAVHALNNGIAILVVYAGVN